VPEYCVARAGVGAADVHQTVAAHSRHDLVTSIPPPLPPPTPPAPTPPHPRLLTPLPSLCPLTMWPRS
jgi:hypothetical protein